MHSKLFSLVFLALSVLAEDAHAAADANPSLVVHVAPPSVDPAVGGLYANTTVINRGKESISILRDAGILRPHTENFAIVDALGNTAAFNGVKAKWSPEAAVKAGNSSSILILAPGESVTVHHDLVDMYDLSSLDWDNKPQIKLADHGAKFYIVNPETGGVATTTATVMHEQMEIQVPMNMKFKTLHAAIQAPTPMAGCTSWETGYIQYTIPVTTRYIAAARDYVRKNGGSGALYTKWFGTSSPWNVQKVTNEFNNLVTNQLAEFTYNCHASAPHCRPGDYAYVRASDYGVIYLCDKFWQASVYGYDSKASTLVHEVSHFIKNGGTRDYEYGQYYSEILAGSRPDAAVNNACNYEYFSVDAATPTSAIVDA